MTESASSGICARIRQIRLEVSGPRGKAAFAKKLGLSASTYDYYESSRVPPANVLVRIAEVAGVDLSWLLTGQAAGEGVPASHPVVQRAAKLLAEHPNAAATLSAFVQILAQGMRFPAKAGPEAAEPAGAPDTQAQAASPEAPEAPEAPAGLAGEVPGRQKPQAEWIPVLGRSAAGVPQFWSDEDESVGITTLAELVERHCDRPDRQVSAATADAADAGQPDESVQVITLRGGQGADVAEFVASPGLKGRYPDAFAVRIDGESMSPSIRHGDLVVVSPSQPAKDGQPAVVQLARQIGVTCKLYRRTGDTVHLVPINEQFVPQEVPLSRVRWACRVVARVRS